MISIIKALTQAADRFPGKPAILFGRSALPYGELLRHCNALAGFLLQSGLRKGDTVAVLLRKTPEAIVSFLGVAIAGGVPFSVDYNQTPERIRMVLDITQPSALIVDSGFLDLLPPPVRSGGEGRTVIVVGPRQAGGHPWDDIISRAWPPAQDVQIQADDAFYLNFTSGSTGAPKAAMATYDNIYWNARSAIETLGLNHEDVHLCMFPIFGHPHEIFARSIYLGSTIVLVDSVSPRAVTSAITEHNVTCLMATASIYASLLRFCEGHAMNLGSLRLVENGGMRASRSLLREFKERIGVPIVTVWGSTETTGIALAADKTTESSCLGKMCRYYEVRLMAEDDRECNVGEIGELAIRGPAVCRAYYRNPEQTAQHMRGGWFYSGDLARRDADGCFHFVGRRDGMLKVKGLKVFPAEIEEVLEGHPAIDAVAVVPAHDARRGEVPKAVLVLKPGKTLTETDVRRYCEEHLPSYKVPRLVEFVAKLPQSQAGKVLYRQLAAGKDTLKPD
ncbi:MAG: class I adenylate-forming enzyme family protein [Kiritimatiellae bacterium]|nr:class I adenylate-forming enzyme family protein [Kiritimatiellia bacterium]